MPHIGKSGDEIEKRRALKRRFIQLCSECANIAPIAMKGNGILNGAQTGQITIIAGDFFKSLTAAEILVLRTAKGCNRLPPNAKQKEYLTLADFLKIPTLSVEGAGCMAAFVHDLIAWGEQIIDRNPNTFNAQDKANFKQTLFNSLEGIVSDEDYAINPAQYGEPTNPSQAYYWLLMKLTNIVYGECDVEPGDREGALKIARVATTKWRTVAEKGIAKELFINPNIQSLLDNFPKAYDLMVKNYGHLFS